MAGPFLAEENKRRAEWIKIIIFTFEFIRVVIVRFLVCYHLDLSYTTPLGLTVGWVYVRSPFVVMTSAGTTRGVVLPTESRYDNKYLVFLWMCRLHPSFLSCF